MAASIRALCSSRVTTSVNRSSRSSVPHSAFSNFPPHLALVSVRRSFACMAAQSGDGEKLDKSTSEDVWKKMLSAEQVSIHNARYLLPSTKKVSWASLSRLVAAACASVSSSTIHSRSLWPYTPRHRCSLLSTKSNISCMRCLGCLLPSAAVQCFGRTSGRSILLQCCKVGHCRSAYACWQLLAGSCLLVPSAFLPDASMHSMNLLSVSGIRWESAVSSCVSNFNGVRHQAVTGGFCPWDLASFGQHNCFQPLHAHAH